MEVMILGVWALPTHPKNHYPLRTTHKGFKHYLETFSYQVKESRNNNREHCFSSSISFLKTWKMRSLKISLRLRFAQPLQILLFYRREFGIGISLGITGFIGYRLPFLAGAFACFLDDFLTPLGLTNLLFSFL